MRWVDVDLPDIAVGFSKIAFNGTRFIALVNDGQIFSSIDGENWARVHELQNFRTGELMVDAVGGFIHTGRDGYVARSADGLSWSQQQVSGNPDLQVAFSGNGRIVAIEPGFSHVSMDGGTTWIRHALPSLPQGFTSQSGIAYGAGVWIAVQGAHVLQSLDGENRTAGTDFVPLPTHYGSTSLSVTYGNGEFIITGQEDRILRSLPMREALRGAVNSKHVGVASGDFAELAITLSGPTNGYQWYEGESGDTLRPVEGATEASFTTPSLTENANYWVRVSGDFETVDSGTFKVIVAMPPLRSRVTVSSVRIWRWSSKSRVTPRSTTSGMKVSRAM